MPWYVNLLMVAAAILLFDFTSEWFVDHYHDDFFNDKLTPEQHKKLVNKLSWMCFLCFLLGIWIEQCFPN